MSETWVFNTKSSDKMIDVAAQGIAEGWLISVYRVSDEDRLTAQSRNPRYAPVEGVEVYDQDA